MFVERTLGIGDKSYDILKLANLQAALESAAFFSQHMLMATPHKNKRTLLAKCIADKRPAGLNLEFGVASGRTINIIASQTSERVYGFDGFTGLPEKWRPGFEKGRFAQKLPEVANNVELVVGLFNETLPGFLKAHPEPVSFLHIDCDLYSSTAYVFKTLGSRIGPGTIIAFDEYLNYPGWQSGEHQAFMEFIQESGLKYEYVGLVPTNQQVSVLIK